MSNAKYAFLLLSSIHAGLLLSMCGYVFQTISQYPLERFDVFLDDQYHGHSISFISFNKIVTH